MEKEIVKFKLDKSEDIWNWWHACNESYMGVNWKDKISPALQKEIVGKTQEKASEFLKDYLEENYYTEEKFLSPQEEIEIFWKSIEKEVFRRIKNITKKPVWPKSIICYYTTFPRGRYGFDLKKNKARMFMDPLNFSPKERFCRSIVHELLHFQVHKYFWQYLKKKGLIEKQVDHTKEALTFLLNEEFIDLFKIPEKSYEIHWQLREDLAKFWRENKDFQRLLNYSAELIKTKYKNLK